MGGAYKPTFGTADRYGKWWRSLGEREHQVGAAPPTMTGPSTRQMPRRGSVRMCPLGCTRWRWHGWVGELSIQRNGGRTSGDDRPTGQLC